MRSRVLLLVAAAALAGSTLVAAASSASPFSESGAFSPIVPVSAFARPASWFDPSRLHVNAEVSFGTSFGGQSSGLQVTRFSYQVARPLAMQVSVGNAFGGGVNGNGQFFLEGFDLQYQPFRSMSISVNYRDIRSPLQLPYGYGGYNSMFAQPYGRLTP